MSDINTNDNEHVGSNPGEISSENSIPDTVVPESSPDTVEPESSQDTVVPQPPHLFFFQLNAILKTKV